MDNIKELKQQYLREKILDKNYDAEEFMDFCESNHGSIDIDSWTFQHLKMIVQQFLQQKNKPQQQFDIILSPSGSISPQISNEFGQWNNFIQQSPPKKENQKTGFELNLLDLDFLEGMGMQPNEKQQKKQVKQVKNPIKIQQPKKQNKFMEVPNDIVKKLQQGNSNFIVAYNESALSKVQQKVEEGKNFSVLKQKSDGFQATVECKKAISKCRLTGKQEILVNGHEIVNPNIFVPKYVLYSITTNPLNVEVKRRIKDFQNLRTLLIKFFPTIQIPHLERCSRLSSTEPQVIKKQILFLQSFLNGIMMNQQLKCKLVEQFLLCKDLDLLKKIFKEYEKLKKPQSIQTLFTSKGTVEVNLSNKNQMYLGKQRVLHQEIQESMGTLKTLYDSLMQGFLNNVKTLTLLSQVYTQMKDKIKAINKQFTPQYQSVQLQKQLGRVQNLHKQWSQSFKTQAKIIDSQVRHLCRFQRDNVQTLAQLLKIQQQMHETYIKRNDKDQSNRQPYQSKKLNDFKITLESPSKHITVLKYQAGYFQQQSCQESRRYLQELSQKIANKFKLFCTLQLNIERDMQGIWKDFDTFYL